MKRFCLLQFACVILSAVTYADVWAEDVFRLGIIGTTTSHVPAFAKIFNDPNIEEPCNGFKIVAAYPGGMPDNPDSWNRVKEYADGLEKQGVKIYNTIEEMLPNVDGVLLESVDGRPHLEQAKPVIAAGKPLYIDKPMAGSLADVLTIFQLAKEKNVPVFSASSLRYVSGFQKIRNGDPAFGKVLGCDAWSPCSINTKHPDLFWYGIHGVETLFTIMGTGCETVRRTQTKDTEFVVGVWNDGRIGTFRGTRNGTHGYGATVFGEKKTSDAGTYEGYKPLAIEIAKFFKTGKPPIDPQETIEIFAFMEAADVSKSNGNAVSLESVIESAKKENAIPAKIQVAADGKLTLNGKPIEKDNLKSALNALVKQPNDRVKVTLISEKETPIETVQEICNHLGNAMLVNYVYDYR